MDVVSRLESELTDALRSSFEVQGRLNVSVYALLNLEFGHFASNVGMDNVGIFNIAPSKLNKILIEKLSASTLFSWLEVGEFINATVKESVNVASPFLSNASSSVDIIIPPRLANISWLGYLRVISSALLQVALAKAHKFKGFVHLLNKEIAIDDVSIKSLFITLAQEGSIAHEGKDWSGKISLLLEGKKSEIQTLWLYPDCLDKKAFKGLFPAENNCVVRSIDRKYLTDIESNITPEWIAKRSANEINALLLLLASPVLGGDLDTEISVLKEKENIPWYMNTTFSRLARLLNSQQLDIASYNYNRVLRDVDYLGEIKAELSIRLMQLPLFLREGARVGAVSDSLVGLKLVLDLITRWINEPRARLEIESLKISENDRLILSGAFIFISAIMQSCLLFQDQKQTQL